MKNIFLTILMVLAFLSKAQTNLDDQYIPNTKSIFNSEKVKAKSENEKSLMPNLISTNLLLPARGQMGLFYERRFGSVFAIKLGTAFSFGPDYSGILLNEIRENDFKSESKIAYIDIVDGEFNSAKPLLSASVKFYFETYDAEKYVELNFRTQKQNFIFTHPSLLAPYSIDLKTNMFNLMFGNYWEGDGEKISFFHDLSFGAGLSISSFDQFQTIYNPDFGSSFTDNRQYISTPTNITESKISFVLFIGYSIGLNFK